MGVTTLLSKTKPIEDQMGLQNWRNRVGNDEADRVLGESHVYGNSLDKLCEMRLNQEPLAIDENEPGWHLYQQLAGFLDTVESLGTQLKLYSPRMKLVGKPDCIGLVDGVLSMIDIKNSRKPKRMEYVKDYFFQCAFYTMMLHEMTGLKVKQFILPIAIRGQSTPQIFIEKGVGGYVEGAISRFRQYCKLFPAHIGN